MNLPFPLEFPFWLFPALCVGPCNAHRDYRWEPGKGAANGILLKSAEALETAHGIDTVVLDKTGTITKGQPAVTDMAAVNGTDETGLLQVAASLEKLSEHPLAEAIVSEAESRNIPFLPVKNFRQIPGRGYHWRN